MGKKSIIEYYFYRRISIFSVVADNHQQDENNKDSARQNRKGSNRR